VKPGRIEDRQSAGGAETGVGFGTPIGQLLAQFLIEAVFREMK